MKSTKVCLRNYADTLKNSVERGVREKKTKAIRAYIESGWLKIDPEFKELRSYFELLKVHQNVKNEFVDLLEENSLEIRSFYRDTDARDFGTYKEGFPEKLKYNSVKRLTKVEAVYDQETREARETYNAIVVNVERVPARQGVAHLGELGFNVDVFKGEETRLPMITADKSKLRLPSETADSEWKH